LAGIETVTLPVIDEGRLQRVRCRGGVATSIGGRPYQQDKGMVYTYGLAPDSCTVALVCDGHGAGYGEWAAETTRFGVHQALSKYLNGVNRIPTTAPQFTELFQSIATQCHDHIRKQTPDDPASDSGTTLCAAVVPSITRTPHVVVCNSGDSQCLVIRRSPNASSITRAHNASSGDESYDTTKCQLNKERTHVVATVQGSEAGFLAVTRAIGHHIMADQCGIKPTIETTVIPVSHGDVVVVASDGFFDCFNKSTALQSSIYQTLVGITEEDLIKRAEDLPKMFVQAAIGVDAADPSVLDNITVAALVVNVSLLA
jgi:serine/threonine protein phosphatase PrpC